MFEREDPLSLQPFHGVVFPLAYASTVAPDVEGAMTSLSLQK
jgi:hypothetical protein